MATSSKANLGPTKKIKASPVAPVLKSGLDFTIGKNPKEALTNLGWAKAFRVAGGITKLGGKYVNKVYRNIGK